MMRRALLALVLAGAMCAPALAAIGPRLTNTWSTTCTVTTGTTWTCVLSTPQQAGGNLLLLSIFVLDTAHLPTLTTPTGFTASLDTITTSASVGYIGTDKTSSAVTSISTSGTMTSGDTVYISVLAFEFANYNTTPVDQHGFAAFSGQVTCTGPSKTPSQTNDTVIGFTFNPVVASSGSAASWNAFGGASISGQIGIISSGFPNQGWIAAGLWQNYAGSSAQAPALTQTANVLCGTETLLLTPGTLGSYAGAGTSKSPALYPAGPGGFP